MPASDNQADVVIITALEEERDAVLSALGDYRKLDKQSGDVHTYYSADLKTDRSDHTRYRVIVTCLINMGPLNAATQAVTVVNRWKPRYVLLVGIACGVPGEVRHGDVMVAWQVVDYTLGKRIKGQRKIRWEGFQAGASLLDSSNNVNDDWKSRIPIPRPGEGLPARHKGVIASGGDVVQDKKVIAQYTDAWSKLIGIEMEAGGVAAALNQTADRPEFLMIKAVSDFGKDKKDPAVMPWRPYACHAAAAFAVSLLKSGPAPGTHQEPPTPAEPAQKSNTLTHLPAFTPATFIRREDGLEKLRDWATHPGTYLLTGDPGSGKSTLALMFATEAQPAFEAVIHQTCGQRGVEAIAADLANTLKPYLGDQVTQLPAKEKIAAIRQWLTQRRTLLVLDDVWLPDPGPGQPADTLSLGELIPGSPTSVLFTSRRPALPWVARQNSHIVDAFTEDEVRQIFRLHLGDETEERHHKNLLEFANRVGRLPLAVTVGAQLLQSEFGPLSAKAQALRLEDLRTQIHDVPGLLQRAIDSQGENEQRLLRAAAVCVPEGFWLPLVVTIAGLTEEQGATARDHLVNAALLRVTEQDRQRFDLHMLVRDQLRTNPATLNLQAAHAQALEDLFKDWETRWRECRECLDEIIPAINFLHKRNPGDEQDLIYQGYSTASRTGELETAFRIAQELESLWGSADGPSDRNALAVSYGNQALIMRSWGRLDDALALHKREEAICVALNDQDGLQTCYGNQALVLRAWGRPDDALALLKKQEDICIAIGNQDGLQNCYGNQALILKNWGRLNDAFALLNKVEAICLALGNQDDLQRTYGNQSLVLQDWGRLDDALALLKRQEDICLALGNQDSLQSCYGNQALILGALGRLDDALALLNKVETICLALGNQDDLQRTYGNQALVLQAWGRLDDALSLLKRQEDICLALGNQDSLQRCYGNQAALLRRVHFDDALALLKKQEDICLMLGSQAGLGYCQWNWGLLARAMNDPVTAQSKLEAALAMFTELKMPRQRDAVQEALNEGSDPPAEL